MAFTNSIVTENDISISHVELKPLSPKYMRLNLSIAVVFTTVLLTILVTLVAQPFFDMPRGYSDNIVVWLSIVFALGAINFTYHLLADPKKGYALREHDLHYQCGLIFRNHICQPILRIQHIEVKRGPLERKVGLATLQVFSAGGVTHTFFIPGLPHEEAIRLRSFILDHGDLTLDE